MQNQNALDEAARHLREGNIAQAEQSLAPLLALPPDPHVLHLMGRIRYRQKRHEEALSFLSRSLALQPGQPPAQVNLGLALAALGRFEEAIAAYRAALALRPGFVSARLALAGALTDTQQFDEAEAELRLGLAHADEPRGKAALHADLGVALRRRAKEAAALENFESAQALDPGLGELDFQRAELLQNLQRYEESLALYRDLLRRYPEDAPLHHDYNDLVYRLGREEEYLKSFDRAPALPALGLVKARFLMQGRRSEEAHEVYAGLLARDPGDKEASTGDAMALVRLGRHDEAALAFENTLARHPNDANLHFLAATASLTRGDPQRAIDLCEKGLVLAPANQGCLAAMGTALRLLGDERDETLSGYDSLIRVFDLEPPEGFSDMAAFNAELAGALESLHPPTREYISQSLRGGTQTGGHIFDMGHDLIGRLQRRITEALGRYIAELKTDEAHPFLSRRRQGFSYAGSWSSRLSDCGFHVNHIHPVGWISSCYYVGVPDVVADPAQRQGWIKFGEPELDVKLAEPIRRAIQPVPGRLVLFPSYVWHGTVPFHAPTPRLTIAFDAVPK